MIRKISSTCFCLLFFISLTGLITMENNKVYAQNDKTNSSISAEISIIKMGEKGNKVKEVQEKLNKFGYNLIVDGDFGPLTFDAVLNFQYRLGLISDGIVGPQTLTKLNEEPTPETTYLSDTAVPALNYSNTSTLEDFINDKKYSSSTDFFIWVDLNNQKVNVFQGSKGQWKLLRSMTCASGAPATPTPKGFFKVQQKGPFFRVNSNIKCDYYTGFYGNYLFHTVLLDNNGNIADGTLGVPVSHGCIRLAVDNAKFIYFNIPLGTTVWTN